MSDCRECHSIAERDRQRRHRQRENGMIVGKYASQIARSRKFERTNNLLEAMVRSLGGANNFLAFWKAEIDRVSSRKRVTCRVLRFAELIVAADVAATRGKPAAVKYTRADAQEAIRLVFLNEPGLVAAAARQVGVMVVWAEDVQTAST